jgi:isoaspartyl peptidase/L-asparaginase-like protein (Ntn-hydrolase superfamily)
MFRLLFAFAILGACATPADDPMVPPPAGPVVYKRPDCPSTPRIAVRRPSGSLEDEDPIKTMASGIAEGALVVTHGGAGSKPELADGPAKAAKAALALLVEDKPALDAAVEGTVVMEDDPRFNAGTGSNIRLDGKTIQMDAALMTHEGEFAAVAVIERVKNPIRVARLVLDSPHVLMAGEGATRFAHRLGVKDEVPVSAEAEKKYKDRMARLAELTARMGRNIDWRALWNYPTDMPDEIEHWAKGGDTVGTVARDREGGFAATLSTGGTSLTLYGRVGDVPVYGAGLFAGQHGAVACTGEGEEIIRQALARTVYLAIEAGTPARDAVSRAVREFPEDADVGLIAVDRFGWAVGANTEMAYGQASEAGEPGK